MDKKSNNKNFTAKKASYEYKNYASDHKDFRSWIDTIFESIGFNTAITAFLIFLILYFIGLVPSYLIHFHINYIKSPAIYIACFGITWVFLVSNGSSKKIHYAFEFLRPCFIVDDSEYKNKITFWFSKFRSLRGNLIFSLILFFIALMLIYLSIFHPHILKKFYIASILRPAIFPLFWIEQDYIIVKFLILLYFAFWVCFALGTSARMLYINFFFLLSLKEYPVIPISNVLKSRFRVITDFYNYVTLAWFVGVALFIILFYPIYDIFAIILLILLCILGLLTFFTPQIMFRQYLISSYRSLCDLCINNFYKKIDVKLLERINKRYKVYSNSKIFNLNSLLEIISVSNKPPLWVYDSQDFLILFIGQLLPFIVFVLQKYIEKIL